MIMDTLLHELCHNRFGPHDANFHALWDQLRDQYSALMQSGFTGDAFLSHRHLSKGKRISQDQARRIARAAVGDSHKKSSLTVNQKLGRAGIKPRADISSIATGGAFGRMQTSQGCGCDMPESEQKALVAAASVNVMKCRVEKDDANEVAIQEALWELAQENRVSSSSQQVASHSSATTKSRSLSTTPPVSSQAYDSSLKSSKPYDSDSGYSEDPSLSKPPPQYVQLVDEEFWHCETCTLINKEEDVSCDACGTARPGTEPPPKATSSKTPSEGTGKKPLRKAAPAKASRTCQSWSRVGPSRQVARSGAWQCACSLINEGRVCCAACGIGRPGS